MRHYSTTTWFERQRRTVASITLACFCLSAISPALAGGYVDGKVVLRPATAINTGAVSITPTFNNDQFNDRVLVGTVNNDPVRTPSTADPVSTVTGNNYHDETDLMIRGRNGLNTVFTRTYNSEPSATKTDRGLGYGWSHSYLMRLKSNDFGDCPNCTSLQRPENGNSKTSSISYTDERGGEQNYLVNETSFTVTSPKGVYDTLQLNSPAPGQHTLSFRNGVKYIFETPTGDLKITPNLTARLKFIDNPWGDRLTLTYDANGRLSTLTDNLGIPGRTGLTFAYDINGRLQSVADWTARQWRYSYDATGNLITKTNPLNEALSYSYDAPKHLLTGVTLPLARAGLPVKTGFKYYENGRTFQQTDSFNVGDTLDYDLYRKSTRVTDAKGFVREYFYDDNGRMTKLTEPDGGVLLFENQSDAIRSKKYDALGYATSYSYRNDRAFSGISDVFGNVTREQDALNRTMDTGYGPLDQVATIQDKRGTVMSTTYAAATSGCDYLNRPQDTRINSLNGAANVLLSSYCWNSDATPNTSRRYLDATHYTETRLTYEIGSNGLNVAQTQSVGLPSGITITQTATYDSLGRQKTQTLKRRASPSSAALIDLTTAYDYDALDRIIKMTDTLGNEILNSFDANGQLQQVTQRLKKPDGTFDVRTLMTRTFDANDRVKTQTDVLGNITTYQYDPAGNVISMLDAEGHTTRFEYDPLNRRTAAIDATGYRTTTKYSLRGDMLAVTNANNETLRFENDALGRKTAMIDAKAYRSEFQYDPNGNLICTVNANAAANLQPKNLQGCSESRTYDELNRVTKITDALNNETRLTYDLVGNRLTLTDAENKTASFAFDDLGRLQTETDHLGLATRYKLDEAGNVFEQTNRLNEVTRVSYDNANRPTRVDYLKDNTTETFGYDVAGNRNSAANGNVGYSFAYDRANRLTQKTDSRGRTLSFSFDRVGNILTKATYQGSTTTYLYNAANRLVQLRNPDYLQADYQYDPAGRLLSRVTSSGARSSYQYDANGGLTKLTQYDAANALISDINYTRDRLGNILTQTDAAGTSSFVYDALYRLQSADYPGAANDEAFTYDKVGNRQTKTQGSLTPNANTRYYSYSAGTNRLSQIRIGSSIGAIESSFSQDLEGRLVSQTGANPKTLTWDAKGRVKSLNAETYSYDPMDYRIQRSGGSLGNLSYFLEGEHLESVYDASGIKERYLRGSNIDELVAGYLKDTDGKTKPFLFHQDNVTSTTAVSGHNGGTIQSLTYGAFGNTLAATGSSPSRLKYTGREDDQTGLYYYRARYYDPTIGRFISEDPLGFAAGINFYAYVGNNPLNANDPSGLVTQFIITRDKYGVISYGSHAAVRVDNPGITDGPGRPVLFDPAGSVYNPKDQDNHPIRGSGDYFTREDANLNAYVAAQQKNGSSVYIYKFQTTPEQEAQIANRISGGDASPAYTGTRLFCAVSCAAAVRGIGPFKDLGLFYTPGGLEQDLINIQRAPQLTPVPGKTSNYDFGDFGSAAGGFLLYPNKSNTNQVRSVYAK